MLQFFGASSSAVNSARAMSECVELALQGKDPKECKLLVFHTTMGHNQKDLLNEAKKLCPNAEVVGCTVCGIITQDGANESMRALGVIFVTGDKNEIGVSYHDSIVGNNSLEVSRTVAKDLKKKSPDTNMILLIASGIDIAADHAIQGIEEAFGSDIPIFGGTSSDNVKAISSFQFVGNRILERGIIMVGFADPNLEVVCDAHHGCPPIGTNFTVTRAEANRIYEINGKPAWPFLTEQVGLPLDASPVQLTVMAPLGVQLPEEHHDAYDNKHLLRAIFKKCEKNESVFFPTAITPGTKLWLMGRDEKLIFDGLDRMMGRLKTKLGGREPVCVFHSDCVARGRIQFNKILKEELVSKMQYPICGDKRVPWLGMYGFGEFGPLNGKNMFHNYTTSIYAIVKKEAVAKKAVS
jgi:hypothetical protein